MQWLRSSWPRGQSRARRTALRQSQKRQQPWRIVNCLRLHSPAWTAHRPSGSAVLRGCAGGGCGDRLRRCVRCRDLRELHRLIDLLWSRCAATASDARQRAVEGEGQSSRCPTPSRRHSAPSHTPAPDLTLPVLSVTIRYHCPEVSWGSSPYLLHRLKLQMQALFQVISHHALTDHSSCPDLAQLLLSPIRCLHALSLFPQSVYLQHEDGTSALSRAHRFEKQLRPRTARLPSVSHGPSNSPLRCAVGGVEAMRRVR